VQRAEQQLKFETNLRNSISKVEADKIDPATLKEAYDFVNDWKP